MIVLDNAITSFLMKRLNTVKTIHYLVVRKLSNKSKKNLKNKKLNKLREKKYKIYNNKINRINKVKNKVHCKELVMSACSVFNSYFQKETH